MNLFSLRAANPPWCTFHSQAMTETGRYVAEEFYRRRLAAMEAELTVGNYEVGVARIERYRKINNISHHNMKQYYFIRFECSSGSLAIEKAMYDYITSNYRDTLVSKDAISGIVMDIRSQIKDYMASHKGKSINCEAHPGGGSGGLYYISTGQLYMTLVPVRRAIDVKFKEDEA